MGRLFSLLAMVLGRVASQAAQAGSLTNLIVGLALCLSMAPASHAALIITATEGGGNLDFSYSGSLDLTGMNPLSKDTFLRHRVAPGFGAILSYNTPVDLYSAPTLPDFGTGQGTTNGINGITTGDAFAVFSNDRIGLPGQYVSGNAISGELTFVGESFASVGMFSSGSFTSVLPSGDSITLRIAATSVPEPATLALIGLALAGLGFSRRKRSNQVLGRS